MCVCVCVCVCVYIYIYTAYYTLLLSFAITVLPEFNVPWIKG